MLTDERYGEINHPDGNWFQLLKLGFILPEAKLIPILNGQDRNDTTLKFNENLKQEFQNADYKIGIFGIGADGHTAGILPQSTAVDSEEYAYYYETPKFNRITMTPLAISLLDEAIVFMKGEEKWPVVMDLLNKDIDLKTQPAQVLKKLPKLTIFTDYQNK
jgi:6-phosphogluconolactonase/glucosamine-6-phosphate isomerase/deaminase